jgi:hypothetical protein
MDPSAGKAAQAGKAIADRRHFSFVICITTYLYSTYNLTPKQATLSLCRVVVAARKKLHRETKRTNKANIAGISAFTYFHSVLSPKLAFHCS